MLIVFSSLLGLLICIEIALSIALLALARGESLDSVVEDKMRSSMKHFEVEGYEGVTTGKRYEMNTSFYYIMMYTLCFNLVCS